MNHKLLLVLPILALSFTGCEKKTTPMVGEPTMAQKAETAVKDAAEKTKDAAIDAKDAVADKLAEWKLTPSDLKADFEKGGRIVRSKAASATASTGAVIDNAKVVTVINAKLVGDSQLSALKINVDADNGVVTLKGTVKSIDLIGRAIALALNTDGVTQVVSVLTVSP
ncbi:MAG: BON domain-containing protein [Verrucomicrobia bacterium]|nr:BON domain-containing protein [Verrucomicrobiota bacterium]